MCASAVKVLKRPRPRAAAATCTAIGGGGRQRRPSCLVRCELRELIRAVLAAAKRRRAKGVPVALGLRQLAPQRVALVFPRAAKPRRQLRLMLLLRLLLLPQPAQLQHEVGVLLAQVIHLRLWTRTRPPTTYRASWSK